MGMLMQTSTQKMSPPPLRHGRDSGNLVGEPHRPKFRSIAAIAMFICLVVGSLATLLGMVSSLRDIAIITGALPRVAPTDDGAKSTGVVMLLWSWVEQYGGWRVLIFGLLMLVIGYVLRRVVLSGLRD
jgi:hypothetical protein